MKRIILFVMACIFSIGTCSQTGGSRTQTTASSRGGPQEAFEIKNSVFFEDGTLDEYVLKDWDRNYTHVDFEEKYSASMVHFFNQRGERDGFLEQIEYAYDDAKGYLKTELTRDTERRLKRRVVYQYQQDRLWRENLMDNKGKVVSTSEYAYDNRGNQTSRVIINRAGARLAETVYTYNAQGQMTASETKDTSGGNAISSTRYSYNANGNLIREQVYDGDGNITSVITYEWRDGKEVKYEMADASGRVTLRILNEYGNNGELVKKIRENIQGDSFQTTEYEYEFRPARRQS